MIIKVLSLTPYPRVFVQTLSKAWKRKQSYNPETSARSVENKKVNGPRKSLPAPCPPTHSFFSLWIKTITKDNQKCRNISRLAERKKHTHTHVQNGQQYFFTQLHNALSLRHLRLEDMQIDTMHGIRTVGIVGIL